MQHWRLLEEDIGRLFYNCGLLLFLLRLFFFVLYLVILHRSTLYLDLRDEEAWLTVNERLLFQTSPVLILFLQDSSLQNIRFIKILGWLVLLDLLIQNIIIIIVILADVSYDIFIKLA